MKCYKVKFLKKAELRCQLLICAYSLKQAKALAEAIPYDDRDEIKASETKAKKALTIMANFIDRHNGEADALKNEIEALNCMRIRCGKEPLNTELTMAIR